jgi:DNA-directed RNA polymerase subunit RPC12/RpoP
LIIKGALDATLALVCPYCQHRQLRARKGRLESYACKRCHKRFRRDQALPPPPRR